MSFARAVFVFALFTPILGATGSRFVVSAILGQSPQTVVAPGAPALPTRVIIPVSTPVRATPPPSWATVATVSSTSTPAASSTADTLTLTRYWLGGATAHPGSTVSVKYAIDNGTGQQQQVSLGVSMKATSDPSWGSAFADPAHDVTAIVSPGSSTHERFFTLPPTLAPGAYDVSWGLRDAAGNQLAVVATAAVLHVVK
jgi:hypothetical protein